MADDTVEDIPSFDPTMKKKKKKKKAADDEAVPAGDEAPQTAPADSNDAPAEGGDDAAEGDDGDGGFDFSSKKKKKKKPSKETAVDDDSQAPDASSVDTLENKDQGERDAESDGDDEEDGDEGEDVSQSWLGTDRDYTYNELLSRAFNIIDGNTPDSARSKRSRMVMKPPSVFREGTKKTVWANFQEICKLMHRSTDHVMAFSLTELGTSGSVDGSYRLVIKGRFTPKQIESVIKHYITEYVTCRTCKSPETNLKKENRLYFVQCRSCGSTRSVAAIKSGFQAQVGKRKKT